MKRLYHLLLLIGAIIGLAAQPPAQAFAVPVGAMDMAAMVARDGTPKADCMASARKDASHPPCKCGSAGCMAMTAAGGSMLLAAAPVMMAMSIAAERDERMVRFAAMPGRTTAPELEPPSVLI